MQTQTINRSRNPLNPGIIPHGQGVKTVLIKFSGGARPPQEALVAPGTTTGELLGHLGLQEKKYALSLGPSDSTFGVNEVISPKINDGDLLFVTSIVEAGTN